MTLSLIPQPQANIPLTSQNGRVMPTWQQFFQGIWNFLFLSNGVTNPYDPTTSNVNRSNVLVLTGDMGGDKTIALSNINAFNGNWIRYVRKYYPRDTSRLLIIWNGGLIASIASGCFADFSYDGTNWQPTISGALGSNLVTMLETDSPPVGATDYVLNENVLFGDRERVVNVTYINGINVKRANGTLVKTISFNQWVDCIYFNNSAGDPITTTNLWREYGFGSL